MLFVDFEALPVDIHGDLVWLGQRAERCVELGGVSLLLGFTASCGFRFMMD